MRDSIKFDMLDFHILKSENLLGHCINDTYLKMSLKKVERCEKRRSRNCNAAFDLTFLKVSSLI